MIVTVGGIKGGTGKSTISTNLAVWLACNKKDVMLVDSNPNQLTSSNWASRRNEKFPTVNCVEKSGDIRRALIDLNKRYEDVVVDVGGWDSKELRTALLKTSVIITPIKASQADIETLPQLAELLDQAYDLNPKLEAIIVVNQAPFHTSGKLVKQTQKCLADLEGFIVSENILYNRKPFVDCLANGTGVVESNNSNARKAKREMEQLAIEVYKKNANQVFNKNK